MTRDTRHTLALRSRLGEGGTLPSRCLPLLLLILAGVLAYWNSFGGAFVYDDIESIRDNPHIRALWPLSEAMSLPLSDTGLTVDGRPLLSLSFALNHALLGPEPWGYHLVNLVIHIGAGLLLFGIVRRTLDLPQFRERYAGSLSKNQGFTAVQAARGDARPPVLKRSRKFGGRASSRAENLGQSPGAGTWLALAVALIWLVHPLQTESVTYIVQRAESLMGFFYLLTLCCAIRGFRAQPARGDARPPQKNQARGVTTGGRASPRAECGAEKRTSDAEYRISNIWYLIAILACALGMGVKEIMFSAPLLVLLYDCVFISDSLRTALTKRRWLYVGLFASWSIVFWITVAGWSEATDYFAEISPVRYALTQPLVLLYYLRLALWPAPLVLSYGWALEDQWPRIVFPGLVIGGMLAVMVRGIWRRKWYGFVVAWFFLILGPTSSIVPMQQALFEHRMYLSLAAVVLTVVVGGRYIIHRVISSTSHRVLLGGCVALALVCAFAYLSYARNWDYHSEIRIWRDSIAHRPESQVAHVNLAKALLVAGRPREAMAHCREAVRLNPNDADAHNNLGNALQALGGLDEAMQHYREAVRLNPDHAEALYNCGVALEASGQEREALAHYWEAVRIDPGLVDARYNLGNRLLALGRPKEAIRQFEQILLREPQYTGAHKNWGVALLYLGRNEEAIARGLQAVQISPADASAHNNLGVIYQESGRLADAIRHFEQAVRLDPDYTVAQKNLRDTRAMIGEGKPGGLRPKIRAKD